MEEHDISYDADLPESLSSPMACGSSDLGTPRNYRESSVSSLTYRSSSASGDLGNPKVRA